MPKEAVFEEICLIPAGNGEDCVGYIDDGSVSPCPQDFLVRDDGSVCILDSVKDRIIIFKDGEVQKYLDYTGVRRREKPPGCRWMRTYLMIVFAELK